MAKKAIVTSQEEEIKVVAEVAEVAPVTQVEESAEKVAFRAHIAKYAKANPTKYEIKKEALEKELNNMK